MKQVLRLRLLGFHFLSIKDSGNVYRQVKSIEKHYVSQLGFYFSTTEFKLFSQFGGKFCGKLWIRYDCDRFTDHVHKYANLRSVTISTNVCVCVRACVRVCVTLALLFLLFQLVAF